MKCEVCGKTLDPFNLTKISKQKYDLRCEACKRGQKDSQNKNDKNSSQADPRSSQGDPENFMVFQAYQIPQAVGIRLRDKRFQGHTWYGETVAEALANARSTVARQLKGESMTAVEME